MLNIFTLANGRLVQEEIESLEELSRFQPIWVDLESPSPEEKRWVKQYYGLSIPEDVTDEDIEESARFYEEDNGDLHVRSDFLIADADEPRSVRVAPRKWLVRSTPCPAVSPAAASSSGCSSTTRRLPRRPRRRSSKPYTVVLNWSWLRIVVSRKRPGASASSGSACAWNCARPDAVSKRRTRAPLGSTKPPGTRTRRA